jgi:hypothetical protein
LLKAFERLVPVPDVEDAKRSLTETGEWKMPPDGGFASRPRQDITRLYCAQGIDDLTEPALPNTANLSG